MTGRSDGARVLVVGGDRLRTDALVQACLRRGLDAAAVRDGGDEMAAAADAVLLDLRSTDPDALVDLAAELASQCRAVLAVRDYDDARRVTPAFDIDGFVDVDSDLDQLVAALRDGTGAATAASLDTSHGLPSLTDRERQVLTELLTGDGTAQISNRLGISDHTVRTHVQNVLAKLGVHSRAEAAAVALRAGLSAPDAAAGS